MSAVTNEPIIIRDLFEGIVNEVAENIDATISYNYSVAQDTSGNPLDIELKTQYMHGTVKELVSRLNEKAASPTHKEFMWPIIALIHNFNEGFGKEDCYNETEFTFWICMAGETDASYPDRYKKTLEPVVYPLWTELMKVIKDSHKFKYDKVKGLDYQKTDRPNWGVYNANGNSAYQLGQNIDGIEIRLRIKLYPDGCNNLTGSDIKYFN